MTAAFLDTNLALHKSNIKIPYEYLNKVYRMMQRELEIQQSNFQSVINKGNFSKETLVRLRDNLLSLKSSIESYKSELLEMTSHSTHILKSLEPNLSSMVNINNSVRQINLDDFPQLNQNINEIFNTHLMHYFFENLHLKTAQKLAENVWEDSGIEFKWFNKSSDILGAIQDRDISKALKWMSENKNRLKKINSKLEFLLQRQEFLKYVYENKVDEAIGYAKKWPKSQMYTNDDLKTELKESELPKLLGLLVFASNSPGERSKQCPRYSDFLDGEKMWYEVMSQFHSDNLSIFAQKTPSNLEQLLTLGISVLKSNLCNSHGNDYNKLSVRSEACPICTSELGYFEKRIPPINWMNTKIFCRGSAALVDDQSVAQITPNGVVYCKDYVERNSSEDNFFKCPVTSKNHSIGDFRRIFLM